MVEFDTAPIVCRVSRIRYPGTSRNTRSFELIADTEINPPPPSVTATAAPIAAQRERIKLLEPILPPLSKSTSIDAITRLPSDPLSRAQNRNLWRVFAFANYSPQPHNAKEPVLTDGLSLDLSGYPEDTLLSRSDSLDVDGFWALATLANLELDLLTINQGATT